MGRIQQYILHLSGWEIIIFVTVVYLIMVVLSIMAIRLICKIGCNLWKKRG